MESASGITPWSPSSFTLTPLVILPSFMDFNVMYMVTSLPFVSLALTYLNSGLPTQCSHFGIGRTSQTQHVYESRTSHRPPDHVLPKSSPSQWMAIPSSHYRHPWPLLLSHPTSNLFRNSVGPSFRIYSESNHFPQPPMLPPVWATNTACLDNCISLWMSLCFSLCSLSHQSEESL